MAEASKSHYVHRKLTREEFKENMRLYIHFQNAEKDKNRQRKEVFVGFSKFGLGLFANERMERGSGEAGEILTRFQFDGKCSVVSGLAGGKYGMSFKKGAEVHYLKHRPLLTKYLGWYANHATGSGANSYVTNRIVSGKAYYGWLHVLRTIERHDELFWDYAQCVICDFLVNLSLVEILAIILDMLGT